MTDFFKNGFMEIFNDILKQTGLAFVFYIWVLALFRFSGKRLAGQTTTFDLIMLISLSVAVQNVTLLKGTGNSITFIIVVFLTHRMQAWASASFAGFRTLVRGSAAKIVENGKIMTETLAAEGLTLEELDAGLRKLGIETHEDVKTAHIEETGHISAIKAS